MIMDGNKRWADLYGVSLTQGYQQGLNKLKEIISVCLEQEIEYLTNSIAHNVKFVKPISYSKSKYFKRF